MNVDPYSAPAAESGVVGMAKVAAVWIGVALGKAGIHGWSDVAAFFAAVYSALLIAGWVVRRWARWRAGKSMATDVDTGKGDL